MCRISSHLNSAGKVVVSTYIERMAKTQNGLISSGKHAKQCKNVVGEELNLSLHQLTEIPLSLLNIPCIVSLNLNYNSLKEVPEILCKTLSHSLKHFTIKGNELSILPTNIGQLRNLVLLDASENNLSALPTSLSHLDNLETLKLTGNEIKELPSDIHRCSHLKYLHLDENKCKQLTASFGELQYLQVLEIGNNKLRKLPENFGELKQLQNLNVSNNKLRELPETFKLLSNLEVVDLSCNLLKFLPDVLASAPRLKKLYADRNFFCNLPQWFSNLESLEELSLENNHLQASPFPDNFGSICTKLKRFDLAANYLLSLPSSFGLIETLEFLHLGSTLHELERRNFQNGNWIERLPQNFGHLKMLRDVRLDENQLVELPNSFVELENLQTLDLGQNKLQRLPDNFGKLTSLRCCLLSKNLLESLPADFGNLKNLTELRVDNNLLTALPESFEKLTQIEVLDLFNNKLTAVPPCLKAMVNLKYLELDENDLGSVEDVPRIIKRTLYAARNPDLKGDWRGKGRQDLDTFYATSDMGTNSEVTEDNKQMYNIITALKQGSALWRSHTDGDSGVRRKFHPSNDKLHVDCSPVNQHCQSDINRYGNQDVDDVVMANARHEDDDDDDDETKDESWDYISTSTDVHFDGMTTENDDQHSIVECIEDTDAIVDVEEGEDWDAEIEKNDPFLVYDDFPAHFPGSVKLLSQPTSPPPLQPSRPNQRNTSFNPHGIFCPAVYHAKPIVRRIDEGSLPFSGQFDDA